MGFFTLKEKNPCRRDELVKKVNLVGLGKEMAKMAGTNLLTNGS